MSELRINGLAELQRFLNQLPTKIETNIMRSALRQGANEFLHEARAKAPKDTTLMSKSLKVSTKKRGSTVYAYVRPKGKHSYLALFNEFGVRPHSLKKGGGGRMHPGHAQQPFMRPAFDGKQREAVIAVGEQIKKRLTLAGINLPDINIGGDE